ncbi:hypothetical protein SH467x_002143 [Pirellulaceae bacterium SH467]
MATARVQSRGGMGRVPGNGHPYPSRPLLVQMDSNKAEYWRGMQPNQIIQQLRTNETPHVIKGIFLTTFLNVNISTGLSKNGHDKQALLIIQIEVKLLNA